MEDEFLGGRLSSTLVKLLMDEFIERTVLLNIDFVPRVYSGSLVVVCVLGLVSKAYFANLFRD